VNHEKHESHELRNNLFYLNENSFRGFCEFRGKNGGRMSELNKRMINTPDLNEERLETLKSLFSDLFTVEGKLNPDELKKIIDPDLVKRDGEI